MAFPPLSDRSNVMTAPLTTTYESADKGKERESIQSTVPPSILLLAVPSLVAHPPDHPQYVHSLHVSLDALRKCLSLHVSEGGSWSLSLEHECRAHGMLAEIGLAVIRAGLTGSDGPPWAQGIENEIDQGIAQGTRLCQQIPVLRIHKPHFALLRANLLLCKRQLKSCRTLLRREINNLTKSHSSSVHYTCYMTLLSSLLASGPNLPPDPASALQILNKFQTFAEIQCDKEVVTLARVTRFQVLIRAEFTSQLDEACRDAEVALGLSFDADQDTEPLGQPLEESSSSSEDESPLIKSLKIHTLMLSVIHHAQTKPFKMAATRLSALHSILDADALTTFPDGVVYVQLATGPPLELKTTHPRVLYEMAFLVSSVSKRDVVGRKPRRKVFAEEGLLISQEVNKLVPFAFNASLEEVQHVQTTLARLRIDLLCELVSISTMRSEFDEATDHFDELVAHARNNNIFDEFASRITLLSAHLAHALGHPAQALKCYRAAAAIDSKENEGTSEGKESGRLGFIGLAGKIGEVALRVGLKTRGILEDNEIENEMNQDTPTKSKKGKGKARVSDMELDMLVKETTEECRNFTKAKTVMAAGMIFQATRAKEIIEIKQYLKSALDIATQSNDNHLRALILAMMSNLYLLTASDHAMLMLQTCRQLASGLGAPSEKNDDPMAIDKVGNAPLGIWVGERFLEVYKRMGKDDKAKKQEEVNLRLQKALERIRSKEEHSRLFEAEDDMDIDGTEPNGNGMDIDG